MPKQTKGNVNISRQIENMGMLTIQPRTRVGAGDATSTENKIKCVLVLKEYINVPDGCILFLKALLDLFTAPKNYTQGF